MVSTNSNFRWVRQSLVVTATALMTLGITSSAFAAVDNNGLFQLGDGNHTPGSGTIQPQNPVPPPDWANLFDSSGNVVNLYGGITAAFVRDDISAGSAVDNTVYSGGPGDKNQDPISQWTWTTSSVPVKDDVGNAYAYAKTDSNGHLIIYIGAERLSNGGDSHIDVEFFQKPVGLDHSVPCPSGQQCHFTGSNTNGDVLVNLDFTNGGTFAGLTVRERQEGATNNYVQVGSLSAQGCNTDGTICAYTNGGTIPGGSWPSFDSHGAVTNSLPSNAFAEYGVDVTALLGQNNLCFSTVQVKTRSSQSFTATLKDFALHGFEKCVANVATQIHSGNDDTGPDLQGTAVAALTVIHDEALATGTVGAPTPTGTVTFKRFATADCTGSSTDQSGVALTQSIAPTATTAGVATADSSNFTTSGGGFVSYMAVYSGDSIYPTANSPCEPLTVNKVNSAVNTDILGHDANGNVISVMNHKVNAGTMITDLATVSGTGGVDPTGTVTFQRFPTADCSGTVHTDETLSVTGATPANGTATATSSTHTTLEGEFVGYKVLYSGDSLYNPSAATVCEPICSFNNTPALP